MSHLENFLEKLWSREEEYIKNLCETVPRRTLLIDVLNMIPKNMIVDLHFQEYYKHPFVDVPAQYCLNNLPKEFLTYRRIDTLEMDRWYGGPGINNFRHILLIELPCYHWEMIKWGEDRRLMYHPKDRRRYNDAMSHCSWYKGYYGGIFSDLL